MTAFQVGDWQVQPSLNRLSRGGEEVRLEPKVMQVLECLAATPGDVVTREELVAQVWPGVFVTDDVLHRAIRELRRAFGDETANPTYIETIRKRGYRLIALVRRGGSFLSAEALGAKAEDPPVGDVAPLRTALAFGFLALALGAVVFALASRPEPAAPDARPVRFVALTSSATNEGDPSPSPDGTRLAFSTRRLPGSVGQSDIFISDGPGGTPVQMTTHPADDRLPAWSPDAQSLAFARLDGRRCDVMLLALADRRERRLASCGNVEDPHLAWSPDGKRVLINASVLGQPDLYVIDAATGETTRLTQDADDEVASSWSGDGASVLFGARRSGTWQVMRLTIADRARTQVTTSGGYAPIESPDGKAIYFTRLDQPGVWMMPAAGGEPRQVVAAVRVGENINWRVTPHGIFFVGVTPSDEAVIRRAPLDGGPAVDVASIANYSWPGVAIAPDGKSVIFARWDRRDSNILAIETR